MGEGTGGAEFRLLFVGDVVGAPGRRALANRLPALKAELDPDLIVVNGENSAAGYGLTASTVEEILAAGADVVSTGNHVYDQRSFVVDIAGLERVPRPANYPAGAPGREYLVLTVKGVKVLFLVLLGRVFMSPMESPFSVADRILAAEPEAAVVVCDMHAEATSEKQAMGWYLDGRASAVLGTHTHVPTSDHRVLPGGTAYVSDVGMVGCRDGILGMDREAALYRFLTGLPRRLEPARGVVTFNSVLVTIDTLTGRATGITRQDSEFN